MCIVYLICWSGPIIVHRPEDMWEGNTNIKLFNVLHLFYHINPARGDSEVTGKAMMTGIYGILHIDNIVYVYEIYCAQIKVKLISYFKS